MKQSIICHGVCDVKALSVADLAPMITCQTNRAGISDLLQSCFVKFTPFTK